MLSQRIKEESRNKPGTVHFSAYGMLAILVLYLTAEIRWRDGIGLPDTICDRHPRRLRRGHPPAHRAERHSTL
jgi:hypothetical protein